MMTVPEVSDAAPVAREDIVRFIHQQDYAVLATVGENGFPQTALMGIAVTRELEILFDTVRSSRKFRNLIKNPRASLVIGLGGPVTIQFEGLAEEVVGPTMAHYRETYFNRWPSGRMRELWPAVAYFVVRPRWLRYSDFNREPATVEELRF